MLLQEDLFRVVTFGTTEEIKRSVTATTANEKDKNGLSLLFHAAKAGRVDAIQHMMSLGVDVKTLQIEIWVGSIHASIAQ